MKEEDSRYPYTYSCDLIRCIAGHDEGGTKLSRADASKIRSEIAKIIGMPDEKMARLLADHYQKNEAAISDACADSAIAALASRFKA